MKTEIEKELMDDECGVAPGTDIIGATVAGIWAIMMLVGVGVGAALALWQAIGGEAW